MKVYVVQEETWDMASPVCIGATLDAAIRALKATYPPPYVVEWGEYDPKTHFISARFSAVPGQSSEHKADYAIAEYEVAV